PPVNIVPPPQATNEDTALVLSSSNGNALSISDLDAGGGQVTVTLSVLHGTFNLATTTGLTFIAGDGTSDAAMTFTGTIVNINAALDGLPYIPTLNYNGTASLAISVNAQGNTGIGGPVTDAATVPLTITAVNDAPVNSIPANQSFNEDTTLIFSSANGNQIS